MAENSNATRKLLYLIGILVVLFIVTGVILNATGVLGSGENAVQVETAEVEIRRVTQIVTASGKVQPETEVKISPDVSGEIIELPVKEGDQVQRGQLLAGIRPDFYEAQVEQAEASVLQAKATTAQRRADLLNAELEAERQKKLFESGSISESEYQQAQTRLETAQAGLEAAQYSVQSAEARLSETQEQLLKTTLYAPMDGTISMLNVELGERVVGTSQMAGTEMMRVARLDRMELEVDVNENDVVNISLGDTAAIEIDAYPERLFKGVVTEIANSARVSGQGTQEQITNFPVKIRILAEHNLAAGEQTATSGQLTAGEMPTAEVPNFRPGMSGTVDVYTHTVEGAVAVPIQAVTVRDFAALQREKKIDEEGNAIPESERDDMRQARRDSSETDDEQEDDFGPTEEDLRRVVFVKNEDRARMVEVETGISDDTHIVILSGVGPDDTVVIGPFRAVSRTLEPNSLVEERQDGPGRPGPRS